MNPPWKSVNYSSNRVKASSYLWQMGDEMHGQRSPSSVRKGDWLWIPKYFCLIVFLLLACQAAHTVGLNILRFVFPVEAWQPAHRPLICKVACHLTIMHQAHYVFNKVSGHTEFISMIHFVIDNFKKRSKARQTLLLNSISWNLS